MSTATIAAAPTSRSERILAASRLFAGLDAMSVSMLGRIAASKRLSDGDRLWSAGDPATHFTLILSGLFKITRMAADGSEAIVALFGPRESIGDVAVLGERAYPASAVVCSETAEVMRVPAAPILQAMRGRADFACSMNRTLIDHAEILQEKIRVMSAGAVPKRLAALLLGLAERFGDEGEDGSIGIPISLSRSELACLIGARVETTIRTIRVWEKQGVLETSKDGFRIMKPESLIQATSARDTEG